MSSTVTSKYVTLKNRDSVPLCSSNVSWQLRTKTVRSVTAMGARLVLYAKRNAPVGESQNVSIKASYKEVAGNVAPFLLRLLAAYVQRNDG